MLYEKWNFTESLYFIVSTCQTSGLLAPSIRAKDPNNLFAPLFVSFLVILAVPLWAYNIGKTSVELVNLDRAQRRQSSVMKRDQEAQEGFMRLAPLIGIDTSDDNDIQVNLAGFMCQLLLFNKIASEVVLKEVIEEFNSYCDDDDCDGEKTAPLWKLVARVRFLQMCQIGMLDRDEDWPAFRDAIHDKEDKSVLMKGSSKMEHDDNGESAEASSWFFRQSKEKKNGSSSLKPPPENPPSPPILNEP